MLYMDLTEEQRRKYCYPMSVMAIWDETNDGGVVASKNLKKIMAATNGTYINGPIYDVDAASDVSELPLGAETIRGAFNRLANAEAAMPGYNSYVAMESGLFPRADGDYDERAFVVIKHSDGRISYALSEAIIFPDVCVQEAHPGYPHTPIHANNYGVGGAIANRALTEEIPLWNGGKLPAGTIIDPKDPHVVLAGRGRAALIEAAVKEANQALMNFDTYYCVPNPANLADAVIAKLGLK